MFYMSQMNPKKFGHTTTHPIQPPYITYTCAMSHDIQTHTDGYIIQLEPEKCEIERRHKINVVDTKQHY